MRGELLPLLIPVLTMLPMSISAGTVRAQEPADLVVVGAVIHTMDPDRPEAEALAVADGRIVAVGSGEEIGWYRGEGTRVIEAGGRAVIPGLIDAHAHVTGLGRSLRILDLVGTQSPEEIAAMVRETAAERAAGAWITGRGWDQNDWPVKEFPSHEILDRVAPENPVFLTRIDGHAAWVNAEAPRIAGVAADTPDPDGGRIVRDEEGVPAGVLVDNAQALVARSIPSPGPEEREARLAAAVERIVEVGLTGVHDMGVNRAEIELYREWAADGRLLPRIVAYLGYDRETLDWWDAPEASLGLGGADPKLRVAGVKMYADGALGSRGAALLEPYSDDPDNRGLLVTDPGTLAARTTRALRTGLQPAIHAIGDRGNRVALDAIGAARSAVAGDLDLPPRIEHAQVIALEDIPRFAEMGVVASVQPTHATSDMPWAEDRVGPERIEGAYAWNTLREAGVALACGSDFPVEKANPFHGLYAAVARRDREGWPEGGWRPGEAMTREEALACFTRDAAAAAGMEDEVGSLEVGKRADFLVLDADPMAVPEEEIWRIRPLRTVIGGKTVFEAASAAPAAASGR